jgi:hypothetical protein
MKFVLKIVGMFLSSVFIFALCFLLFTEENVRYKSSDGVWHDQEINFKDIDYRSMIVLFELYKIKCGAPEARLYRTTPIRYSNIVFDLFRSKKWSIPYKSQYDLPILNEFQKDRHRFCLSRQATESEIFKAKELADLYISGL